VSRHSGQVLIKAAPLVHMISEQYLFIVLIFYDLTITGFRIQSIQTLFFFKSKKNLHGKRLTKSITGTNRIERL
jgi:hypothetical protein